MMKLFVLDHANLKRAVTGTACAAASRDECLQHDNELMTTRGTSLGCRLSIALSFRYGPLNAYPKLPNEQMFTARGCRVTSKLSHSRSWRTRLDAVNMEERSILHYSCT